MKHPHLPSLVVFDLAGTTVRDDGQVQAAFTEALAEQGIAVSAEALLGVRGSTKRDALRGFIPAGPARARSVEHAYASFQRGLSRLYSDGRVRPVTGAEATFAWLRDRGVGIALNTGFDRVITDLLLEALHWSSSVADAVVCGDDVSRGRPAPDLILRAMEIVGVRDVDTVANVGDTTLDLHAASNAGVRFNVGVLSGAHGRERLESAPHTHLLPDVSHLRSLWEAW